MKIVRPVVVDPLPAGWAETNLAREAAAKSPAATTRARSRTLESHTCVLERLKNFRVLDPTCGSRDFVDIAFRTLKDTAHRR